MTLPIEPTSKSDTQTYALSAGIQAPQTLPSPPLYVTLLESID
jgi:hypothetical protein